MGSMGFMGTKAAVTNYEAPVHGQHVSQNPSDLQNIVEAQIVSKNKDNYNEQEEQPNELISGPPKKYIDTDNQQQTQSQAMPLSNFAHSAMEQNKQLKPTNNALPVFDEDNNQNNEMIAEDTTQNAQQNNTNDIFGGMMQQQNDEKNDDNEEEDDQKKEEEQKQTFLSVWQEQRVEQLAKKAKEEREEQEKLIDAGKNELEKFNEQRRSRIEQQRKDHQARESDLRQDYDSVFKHGSIWQQVAKLVDLKADNKKRERMRDLLIILKNQDEKKTDQ